MKWHPTFFKRSEAPTSRPGTSSGAENKAPAARRPLLPQLAPRLPKEAPKRAWDHIEVLQKPSRSDSPSTMRTYRDEVFFRSPSFAFGSFGRVGFISQKSGLRQQVWAVKSIGSGSDGQISGSSRVPSSELAEAALELHEEVTQEIHAMHVGRSLLSPHRVFVEPDGQTFHLVMPLMHGNLEQVIRGVPPGSHALRAQLADAIQQPLAEGLAWLHAQSVFLGDIKPENILVDQQGRMVFSDFGLASYSRDRDHLGGTVSYFAPELFRTTQRAFRDLPHFGGKLDAAKTDLWSLGVVFLETLLGDNPFSRSFWTQDLLPPKHAEMLASIGDRQQKDYEAIHQLMLVWPQAVAAVLQRHAEPSTLFAADNLLRPLFEQLRHVWPHAKDKAQIFTLLHDTPSRRSLRGLLGAEHVAKAPSWSDPVLLPGPVTQLFANLDSVVVRQLAERRFEPGRAAPAVRGRHAQMAYHRAAAEADADLGAYEELLGSLGPSFDELSFRSDPFEDPR